MLDFQKLSEDFKDLDVKLSLQGGVAAVTTEAEFVRALRDTDRIAFRSGFGKRLENLIPHNLKGCWYTTGDIMDSLPTVCTGEKDSTVDGAVLLGTQSYFERANGELRQAEWLYPEGNTNGVFIKTGRKFFVRTSVPQDTYKVESFLNRKPDVSGYKKGATGAFAITFIGDVKPFDGEHRAFTDAQIGHILDMDIQFMRLVQPWRRSIIVFLTDTRRFQFFEIIRVAMTNGFEFNITQSVIWGAVKGWAIYIGMLACNLDLLGYEDMSIEGISYERLLGIGKKYVFSGSFNGGSQGERLVFNIQGFEKEVANLTLLASKMSAFSSLVPKICSASLTTLESHYPVLVLSPLSSPVKPLERGQTVYGRHVAQLIDVVEHVHSLARLAHRDIKPDNIFIKSDGALLLNDWGSASTIGVSVPFEGTFGFYDHYLPGSSSELHTPSIEADLLAVARTSYLMLFNERPPVIGEDVATFWDARWNRFWKEMAGSAQQKDYAALRNNIFVMK